MTLIHGFTLPARCARLPSLKGGPEEGERLQRGGPEDAERPHRGGPEEGSDCIGEGLKMGSDSGPG